MTGEEHVRDAAERVRDSLTRLEQDPDLWIATAQDARPWLVPLSFHWTGSVLLMATVRRSPTYRNLEQSGGVRLALGHTRDVVIVDGSVDLPDAIPEEEAVATAAVTGHDPRTEPATAYVRVTPQRVQAWRNVAELAERTLMRDGAWVATPPA